MRRVAIGSISILIVDGSVGTSGGCDANGSRREQQHIVTGNLTVLVTVTAQGVV